MTKKIAVVSHGNPVSSLIEKFGEEKKVAVDFVISNFLKAMHGETDLKSTDSDALIALIRSFNPQDTIELHLITQFVVLNVQGMDALSKNYLNAKGQAMMMLRLSHHALDQLQRYRGKNQVMSVLNEGNALMSPMVQAENNF